MLKIIQNYVKVAAIGKQNAVICEITDAWLFNYKKNVINKNIEKKGPNIEPWGIPQRYWSNHYMQN